MSARRTVSGLVAALVAASGAAAAQDPGGDVDEAAPDDAALAGSEVIVVEGRAPEVAEPVRRDLAAEEIRRLPGAGNDALRALQALPGFARIPFGLGGLVVRGQSPRDTGVFVDGVRVPIAFHFGGVTSFYPSSLLDRLEVTPGAVGAPWGRVGGAVVAMTAERGRDDRWRAGGEIGLLDTSVHADGPTRHGVVTVGLRRSYIDAILAAVLPREDRVLPRYADAQLRLDGGDVLGRGAWTASVFASDDAMIGDGAAFRLGFARAVASWRRRRGDTQVEVSPWLGVDRVSFEDTDEDEGEVFRRVGFPGGLRASITRDRPHGFVAAGLDVEAGRHGPTVFRAEDGETIERGAPRWIADVGVWVEGLWRRPGGRTSLRPGLRLDRLGAAGEWALGPRLTVSHALGPLTVRESIGLQHQPPIVADLEGPDGNPGLRASRALHGAAAAELDLGDGLAVHGAVFAVASDRLPVRVLRAGERPDEDLVGGTGLGAVLTELFEAQLGSFGWRENRGRGLNTGVELMLQRRTGRVTGWIAYTWTRARRADGPDAPGRPYALDQPHVVNAVASVPVGAWRLGARVRYASGNPVARTVRVGDELRVVGYERLPAFVALDLRVDRAWRRRGGTVRAYLDVQNVTNRDNVEDVSIDEDGRRSYVHGLPILPLVGVEYVPGD